MCSVCTHSTHRHTLCHRQPVGQVTPRECPHRPTSFQGESLPRTRTGRQSWKQDTTLSALHTNFLKLLHFYFYFLFTLKQMLHIRYKLSSHISTFCQNRYLHLPGAQTKVKTASKQMCRTRTSSSSSVFNGGLHPNCCTSANYWS